VQGSHWIAKSDLENKRFCVEQEGLLRMKTSQGAFQMRPGACVFRRDHCRGYWVTEELKDARRVPPNGFASLVQKELCLHTSLY
jgi:hypothetical protein